MLATMTSKGQITLPKEIRVQLSLEVGWKLDFSIEADGSLRVRPLRRGSAELFGLLYTTNRAASTVEQMNEAVGHLLAKTDERSSKNAKKLIPKSKVRR